MTNWQDATDIRFPRDVVFIDRTLVGLFGNLSKLQATGPWRKLLRKHTATAAEAGKTKQQSRRKSAGAV